MLNPSDPKTAPLGKHANTSRSAIFQITLLFSAVAFAPQSKLDEAK